MAFWASTAFRKSSYPQRKDISPSTASAVERRYSRFRAWYRAGWLRSGLARNMRYRGFTDPGDWPDLLGEDRVAHSAARGATRLSDQVVDHVLQPTVTLEDLALPRR